MLRRPFSDDEVEDEVNDGVMRFVVTKAKRAFMFDGEKWIEGVWTEDGDPFSCRSCGVQFELTLDNKLN